MVSRIFFLAIKENFIAYIFITKILSYSYISFTKKYNQISNLVAT